MFGWMKRHRLNSLLVQVAHDKAWLKEASDGGKVDWKTAGRLAANEEKLRQLGWVPPCSNQ